MSAPYIPPGSGGGEAAIRAAADVALQGEIDALEAAGATDAELADALALKQDALTAATDVELAAAVANATATLNASIALKQNAADAATDAELATHTADTTAVHGIADTATLIVEGDARLTDARAPTVHTHTSAAITDFAEAAQDAVAALLGEGTNVTLTYDDAGNTLTITAAGGGGATDPEEVRDVIGVALVGAGLISVAANDATDTITISTTATANATDAALRDRDTHTGEQLIATITGLQAALDAKATAASLTAHIDDATDAHDATAISFTPTGTLDATDAQAAIAEASAEAAAALSALNTHLADAVDAHDASAISFTPTGTIAATDVQAALAEVASEAVGGGPTRVVLGVDRVNNEAVAQTFNDATGLSFPVAASKRYYFKFFVEWTVAAGTTGIRFGINGPASPTRLAVRQNFAASANAENARYVDAYDTGLTGTTSATSTPGGNFGTIEGFITNGVNAGNVILRFASELAGIAVTLKAGSFVEYSEVVIP